MFRKLVSRNDALGRLAEKGYAIAFDSNYLLVRDIPYLDHAGALQIGTIVTKLVFTDQEVIVQEDHQIFFAGGHPHQLDGSPIPNLGGGLTQLALSAAAADVVVQRSFSNKPRVNNQLVGYPSFFEKIESYVAIISGPAIERYGATPLTYNAVIDANEDSVFKVRDTLTSRAEIVDLAAKFKDDVVALIGLGGTGAYLLDFLVKTPVKEIRAFDLDPFHVHNAFRSPGRLDLNEFRRPKADVYQDRYANFRKGLNCQAKFIDESCTADFEGVTFAFVCVDKGSSRAAIFNLLIALKIPFIDVGMGLNRKRGPLNGMMRVTYYAPDQAERLRAMGLADLADEPENLYRANIQIGELNAMNAALAIIKFKQLRGFYFEETQQYHHLFEIGDFKIVTGADED